ncbi:putative peptidoglycan lipid II flippase [Thiohalospira halophila DSM 15071]|uniref:Probable lipid II flippase MurJ n=1 Tax=Thiohalospira halophila DSM 15071 TaxID=1123397 RepID=A0A1I1SQS8_9GAMM|nr:murein biosynthesis integral membrane protein MurJ [Thiohalospira halophila]SFD48796.1 putative peptidoglycan lipid II flippase [Thiohalospira halophila DSM 15071]
MAEASEEGGGLLRSTAVVGGFTLASRVLGFLRDVVLARIFGAAAGTDAFFVAFKIPNFMRRLFAEGAFNQAFVPVLSEYRSQREHGEVRAFVGRVSGTLGGFLLLLTILGVVGAPVLVMVFAPGFIGDPERFPAAVEMLRLTFPYLLFIALTALAGGVLNSYGRFAVPAATPVLLNIALISAAVWAAPAFAEPIQALAWGVLVAGVIQLAFQLPFLARLGLLTAPRPAPRDEGVRRVARLMGPALFGSSVAQVNLLLDTIIASMLATGSVSWLYYADRLVEFPLGVFGIALGTVILPGLSERHAEADPAGFSAMIDRALRWVALIALPATLGLFLLAGPILATLFEYGAFGAGDTAMAGLALMAYSIGLTGFILVKVLAPGFFARQDTRTPMRIAVIAMLTNMVLNIAFVVPWEMAGLPGAHAGLAAATALAAFVNGGLLLRGLLRDGVYRPEAGWGLLALRLGLALVVLVALLLFLTPERPVWAAWGAWERAGALAGLIAAAGVAYFGTLLATGMRLGWLVRRPAG